MTATPRQVPAELLVGEAPQRSRDISVASKLAQMNLAAENPAPIEISSQPGLEVSDPVLPEEDTQSEETTKTVETEVIVPVAVEEEAAKQAEEPTLEETPAEVTVDPPDGLLETREVLNSLIDETKPQETAPVGAEDYDLGDPDSPLVAESNFSPDWSVQLTSFRKPENAEAHWQDVLARHPDLFTGAEKRIIRYDLGTERGVYYRLRIGPFADKDSADLKCLEVQEAGLDCLVIWP